MDLVNGTVTISIGLFIFLVGLSIYGLVIGGVMLAAVIGSAMQRRENIREIRRFNAMMLELQDHNRVWYGNPDAPETGFQGLRKAVDEMEVDQEFLEDRD